MWQPGAVLHTGSEVELDYDTCTRVQGPKPKIRSVFSVLKLYQVYVNMTFQLRPHHVQKDVTLSNLCSTNAYLNLCLH